MLPASTPDVSVLPTNDDVSPFSHDLSVELEAEIKHAAHLLPSQGPIASFVHHNTLHMLEHLPFHEAVKEGAAIFGCEPYLAETRYQQEIQRGRIKLVDVGSVLHEQANGQCEELADGLTTRYQLRYAMLRHGFQQVPDRELRWFVAQTGALTQLREDVSEEVRRQLVDRTRHWVMRDLRTSSLEGSAQHSPQRRLRAMLESLFAQFNEATIEQWSEATWETFTLHALWRTCRQGVHGLELPEASSTSPVRHRDLLLELTGNDSDVLINELLIPLCAAFLDQGFSHAPMPGRERGFYDAVQQTYGATRMPLARWLRDFPAELNRLQREEISPLQSIAYSLEILGVEREERERFLAATLLALRGWAGMLWRLETDGSNAQRSVPPGTLVEYLAIRLILERLACLHLTEQTIGRTASLSELRKQLRKQGGARRKVCVDSRAFQLFQLAQVCGWTPEVLSQLSKPHWNELIEEVEAFDELERRRVLHEAYERRYRNELLDAVAVVAAREKPQLPRPRFQAVFCIDDREESFRRHLEEVAPDAETFAIAGFYGVAMYYRGAGDAHFRALSPVIIKPQHYVQEHVKYTLQDSHRRRAIGRRAIGEAQHRWHLRSRTFIGGMVAGFVGPLASVPLVMRVLFPRATSRLGQLAGSVIQPPSATQLPLQRAADPPGPALGHHGYSLDEMAGIVHRALLDMGLTSRLARLVIFFGHGSSSVNNPHESAYNCGACSGGRGGPNARAFAQMANDPRVRQRLKAIGLEIPDDTEFLAAYHNTCDDSITWYDLNSLPVTHHADFEQAQQTIDEVRKRNAHERCRRFESASLQLTPEEALRHVERRAVDLSEVRPEYNHATNAVTIVGRRWRTRGLFLDRRAFLNSYDPELDDAEHTVLARTLQAAIPVCAGISLEYYFSAVDPEGWGCGSKLPHNVTGLLGVMAGAASDLRPGLSAQMTEIHEPLRQLFVVETTPEAMLSIMQRNPVIDRLVRGHWVQLATLDPHSVQLHLYTNGQFEPYWPQNTQLPTVPSSLHWYRGWRGNLGFALVADSTAPSPQEARS